MRSFIFDLVLKLEMNTIDFISDVIKEPKKSYILNYQISSVETLIK